MEEFLPIAIKSGLPMDIVLLAGLVFTLKSFRDSAKNHYQNIEKIWGEMQKTTSEYQTRDTQTHKELLDKMDQVLKSLNKSTKWKTLK